MHFLLTLVGFTLFTTTMPSERPDVSAEGIARLIDELDSPRYATREEAGRKLFEAGEPALAPLKRALAENRSLEFRLRAAKAAHKLRVYEPGGEITDDLKLRLTVNRASLRNGERLYLTTMVANMSARAIRIELGPSAIANSWENGGRLQRIDGDKIVASRWVVGLGVPGRLAYQTLGPKSFAEFETPIASLTRKKGEAFLSLGEQGYTTLDVPHEGEIVLRVQYQMNPEARHAEDGPRLWSGTARSNPVRIRLVR